MRIKSCVVWLELCSSARLHSGAQRTKKRQGGRPAAQTAAAPPPPAQLIMDTPVTRHTNTAFMVCTVPEKPSQYLVFANINTPRFTTLAYFPVFTKMYQKEDKFLAVFIPKQSYCKIIVHWRWFVLVWQMATQRSLLSLSSLDWCPTSLLASVC